jgi:general secretion pathway protein D
MDRTRAGLILLLATILLHAICWIMVLSLEAISLAQQPATGVTAGLKSSASAALRSPDRSMVSLLRSEAQEAATMSSTTGQKTEAAPAAVSPEPHVSKSRVRKANGFYLRGLRAYQKGRMTAAAAAFAKAISLDPTNQEAALDLKIAQAHLEQQTLPGDGITPARGKKQLLALQRPRLMLDARPSNTIENATVQMSPPIHSCSSQARQAFHLRGSSAQIIRQVLQAYGITALVSDELGSSSIPFDAGDVDCETALTLVRLATGTFSVPLDSERLLLVKDTRENRQRLERKLTETIYLPGLTSDEMAELGGLARDIFEADQVSVQAASETLTLRAPEATLDALNKTLAGLLGGREQFLFDLSMYEVDTSKTRNIGLQLPQSSTLFNVDSEVQTLINNNPTAVNEIISSGLASASDTVAIAAILVEEGYGSGVLTEPFAIFGNGITLTGITLGTLTGNLSLNASDARTIYQAQLRVQGGQSASLMSGTRYPVQLSSYSLISYSSTTGAATTTTTPEIQYMDLGLKLKITPKVDASNRLRMTLDFQLQSLAGTSVNNIPILTNRQVLTAYSVGEGQSLLVASNLSRQETNALNGIPGVSDLSGFQTATNQSGQEDVSELVLVVTPFLLRNSHRGTCSEITLLDRHD